jgi:ABC-type multidrug transport system ATPase subunit
LALIAGLFKPNDGQIFYNGTDLTQMPAQDTYRLVAVCEQQPKLMQKTLWENITYGARAFLLFSSFLFFSPPPPAHATREEVWAICQALNLHDFVRGLPKGYDSLIGTDVTPSGGQAQRFGIARTLLKEGAQLILMDEPTSELDVESQKMVLDYIIGLRGKKTVMFITHNLTALERVDNIYFLQNGKLEECGPHKELLRKKGSYYQFLKISFQMAGKGDDAAAAALEAEAGEDKEPVENNKKKKGKLMQSMDLTSAKLGDQTIVPKTIVQPKMKEKLEGAQQQGEEVALLSPRKRPQHEGRENLLGNFYGITDADTYVSAAQPTRPRGRSRAMSVFDLVPVDEIGELDMDL